MIIVEGPFVKFLRILIEQHFFVQIYIKTIKSKKLDPIFYQKLLSNKNKKKQILSFLLLQK